MLVKPLGDRILVKEISAEKMTKSGILLPDTLENKETGIYQIVEVGNGEAIKSQGLKVGDKILAKKGYDDVKIEMPEDRSTIYRVLYVGKEESHNEAIALIE